MVIITFFAYALLSLLCRVVTTVCCIIHIHYTDHITTIILTEILLILVLCTAVVMTEIV